MYEYCNTVSELNTARHADSVELMDKLNTGKITDVQWKRQSDVLSDAYEKRINEIWAAAQRVRDNASIAVARAFGFFPNQYKTSTLFFASMKRYSDLKLAGLPVKGPEVDAAIEEINHVSEVLTDASAAYERMHSINDQ